MHARGLRVQESGDGVLLVDCDTFMGSARLLLLSTGFTTRTRPLKACPRTKRTRLACGGARRWRCGGGGRQRRWRRLVRSPMTTSPALSMWKEDGVDTDEMAFTLADVVAAKAAASAGRCADGPTAWPFR